MYLDFILLTDVFGSGFFFGHLNIVKTMHLDESCGWKYFIALAC